MIFVKKENRVLKIDEAEKPTYLNDGYDVVELDEDIEEYKVVEKATGGKVYSIGEYNKLLDEVEKLKENNSVEAVKELKKIEKGFENLKIENKQLKQELEELKKAQSEKTPDKKE